MPAWFAEPSMPLDKLALGARWSYQPNEQLLVEVDKLEFAQGALRGNLSGRHQMPLGAGHGPGVADVTGSLDGFQIAQVGRFLPLATPEGLRHWLGTALQGGTLNDVRLRLRGNLAEFPFRADNASERARGEFRVAGRLAGAVLEYAPGHRTPDNKPTWPLAEAINGSIVFDRTRMEIHGETLRSQGLTLSNVKAVIPEPRFARDAARHRRQLPTGRCRISCAMSRPVRCWAGSATSPTPRRARATPTSA